MNQPVLSIDVAKGKSVVAAFLSYKEIFQSPITVAHSENELSTLLVLLKEMESLSTLTPTVVLEATGNYSKPIASFFSSHNYPVVILNPLYTHQLSKKSVRKVKTDPIDASRIAEAFYLGHGTPHQELDENVLELRVLCRQYQHWTKLFREVQQHFRAVLDLLFPGYDGVFQNICNAASLELLSRFPTPNSILAADREELIQVLLQNRRGRKWNETKLDLLLATARNSLPEPYAIKARCIALTHYISLLKSYQHCLKGIEQQLVTLAEQFQIYHLLRSIPGVGQLTAAVFIAEIGDIKRFPSTK